MFWAQSTTRDYIRAEGDFIKRYVVERTSKAEIRPVERTSKAEIRPEEQLESGELSAEFVE